jgi:hypothetical protein
MTTTKATAPKSTRKPAAPVTTTTTDPAKARAARIASALKDAPDVISAAVDLATVEAASESAAKHVEETTALLATVKDESKAAEKARHEKARNMLVLAATLNASLVAPKSGPDKAKGAVITAVVAATGQDRKTVQARVARWVAAGSLSLATGMDVHKAATVANNMLGSNGDAAAFWALVVKGEAPATNAPAGKRKATTAGDKKAATKETPVTVEKAREVIAVAEKARAEKQTPAQRGAELLTALLNAHKALEAAVKDGSATLTKTQATRWESTLKAVPALQAASL